MTTSTEDPLEATNDPLAVRSPRAFKQPGLPATDHCQMHFPPYRLVPNPLDELARGKPPGFKWAKPPAGERHRIGGQPDSIQAAVHPRCPRCAALMTFYGQLDSLNDEIVLGDLGMIYVFVCFDCLEVTAVLQTS